MTGAAPTQPSPSRWRRRLLAGGAIAIIVLLVAAAFLHFSGEKARPSPASDRRAPRDRRAPPPSFVPAIALPGGEIEAADERSGAGTIEGQVVSAADGAGLGGAELTFSAGEASLSARADAEGRFRFAPGEPGTYMLARVAAAEHLAFSPEWGDSPITFVVRAGERIRGVRLALRPAPPCRGQVLDETGRPLPGARVATRTPAAGGGTVLGELTADGEGRFSFIAVEGTVLEVHHDARVARADVRRVMVDRCAVELRLGPARPFPPLAITGRVEGADGRPAAGVTVDASINALLVPRVARAFARAISGADGAFVLAPLEPHDYEVVASVRGREMAAARVRGGSEGLVLRLPATGRLRGQVADERGAAVVRFSVVVMSGERGDGPRGAIWTIVTRYDGRGAFEVEGVPAGRWRVLVVAEGHAPSDEQVAMVAADPAPPPVLAFVLRQGARVHGRVIDRADRRPLAGARVSAEGRAGIAEEVPLGGQGFTDADGRFELRGVPPRRLALLATAAGHHGRVVSGLDATGGRDLGPVEIDLAPTRPGEPPRIELVGIGAVVTMRDQELVLGNVLPDGGAARAGLVSGDVVLAVDGRPVRELGLEEAALALRGAEGAPVVLRVRRAADRRELDVVVIRRMVRAP